MSMYEAEYEGEYEQGYSGEVYGELQETELAAEILEIASEASRDPGGAVVSMTLPFHAALTGERETMLAAAEVSGTTFMLTLASVE